MKQLKNVPCTPSAYTTVLTVPAGHKYEVLAIWLMSSNYQTGLTCTAYWYDAAGQFVLLAPNKVFAAADQLHYIGAGPVCMLPGDTLRVLLFNQGTRQLWAWATYIDVDSA